ncbi:MAG: hypothetical protein A2240_01805 [Candidatus Jacksonbacteria bacterium RIFOXYA2_FULL_43_12]|nr:MAG: hypothetical protein A2240_01805 [Candidatus Jacksonbacteria bacterium RIFOXYA2_FULL_43_12]
MITQIIKLEACDYRTGRPSSFIFHWTEDGKDTFLTRPCVTSDTWWGSLCCRWQDLIGHIELNDMLEQDYRHSNGNPPFVVSSLFPYKGNVLFFPIPQGFEVEGSMIEFISQGLLEEILRGERTSLFPPIAAQRMVQPGTMPPIMIGTAACSIWEAPNLGDITQPLYKVETRTCITKGQGNSTEPRKQTEIWFGPDSGFYSFVQIREEYVQPLEAVLRYIERNGGIGGQTRNGKGRVTYRGIETIDMNVPTQTEADGFMTLSLSANESFNSTDFEPQGSMVTRKGWVFQSNNNLEKRATEMWVEGSWFSGKAPIVYGGNEFGGLIDVTPERTDFSRRIYRHGYPFPVPFKKGGAQDAQIQS